MAKKLGLLSLVLCMALGLCAVTAFAANSSDNAPSAPTAEPQTAISEVSFRQNGTDIQQSMDGGKSWGTYTPVEAHCKVLSQCQTGQSWCSCCRHKDRSDRFRDGSFQVARKKSGLGWNCPVCLPFGRLQSHQEWLYSFQVLSSIESDAVTLTGAAADRRQPP